MVIRRKALLIKFITVITFIIFITIITVISLGRANPPALLEPASLTQTTAVKGTKSSYDLIETTSFPTGDSDITSYQPVTISHKVAASDSLASIATKYHADAQTIVDYPYNEIGDDLTLKVEQILIIPNGYIDTPPPAPPIAKGSGIFTWPFDYAQGKPTISQYAYWWHAGAVDIVANTGTPVRAADNGRVVKVEKLTTGYGQHLILDHGNGLTSLYAHLSQINVQLNQKISKGQVLGSVGSTGRSTGPHLHFETQKDRQPVDPMTLLPAI